MILKSSQEARTIGNEIAEEISFGNILPAFKILSAILEDKNAFRLLDLIGEALKTCPTEKLDQILEMIAQGRSMGGWVVIATALRSHSSAEPQEVLEKTRSFIIYADTWYACDCFGERVPGPYLLTDFGKTISLLSEWRFDANPWVRRAVGVAIHFWAKRSKGAEGNLNNASTLFAFVKPMLDEKEYQAAKGIGWGLKTLGRYYPRLAFEWLTAALIIEKRQPLAIIRRKALTYLPSEMKQSFSRQS